MKKKKTIKSKRFFELFFGVIWIMVVLMVIIIKTILALILSPVFLPLLAYLSDKEPTVYFAVRDWYESLTNDKVEVNIKFSKDGEAENEI